MLADWRTWPAVIRWLLLAPLLALNFWLLQLLLDWLQPLTNMVLVAALMAFILDLPVRWLVQRGLPRSLALLTVLGGGIALIIALATWLLPPLLVEVNVLTRALPHWYDTAKLEVLQFEAWTLSFNLPLDWVSLFQRVVTEVTDLVETLSTQLLSLTLEFFDGALNFLITVVLTLFLLVYGEEVSGTVLQRLPAIWRDRLAIGLRQKFQAFLGGELIIASLYSVLLLVAFSLLKIPFALLLGLVLGLGSLIPFLDILLVISLCGVLLFQDPAIAAKLFITVFLLGQINDNLIEPRLMGQIIGLNPVWILLSVLLGLKIFGILGLFVAVPLASLMSDWLKTGFAPMVVTAATEDPIASGVELP
ncbi:AI-2E family transporter [Synechococcus elongatus]|uniref:AI-2E family transporter n=1 Tax=Synechococcus elongatus TaxID=32046 RepID=UPI000F7D7C44|nr:AI-2E family transporter [Synechococcus elongatus]